MSKKNIVAFAFLALWGFSLNAGALTVGEILAPFEVNPAGSIKNNKKERELILYYFSGSVDMLLNVNAHAASSGAPMFCLPNKWPTRKQMFENFTNDAQKLAKEMGVEKAASLDGTQIILRSFVSRYRNHCK